MLTDHVFHHCKLSDVCTCTWLKLKRGYSVDLPRRTRHQLHSAHPKAKRVIHLRRATCLERNLTFSTLKLYHHQLPFAHTPELNIMDPLSLSASVAGLLSLGMELGKVLGRFISDVKSARQDATELNIKVSALCNVLDELK
jgi:hypothetical protein